MNILDLFCGAGGASEGLHQAGFEVKGVDIVEQPEYPFNFILADALQYNDFEHIDFIWASPPCQHYSYSTTRAKKEYGKSYPDLISKTREKLLKTGKAFVLENVVGSPLRKDLILCGEMFGLRVFRHRIFEIHGFSVNQPPHIKHRGKVGDGIYFRPLNGGCWLTRGEIKGSISDWQKAMGAFYISSQKMLSQAIPPAYSKYIGEQFLKQTEINLSLCKNCYCMTKTIDEKCGKCGKTKEVQNSLKR